MMMISSNYKTTQREKLSQHTRLTSTYRELWWFYRRLIWQSDSTKVTLITSTAA